MSQNYDFEYDLALKVSWYYYVENMTQQHISDIMGTSRMRVIKLLDHARQKGIIQFHFRSEHAYRMELECKLMQRWDLQDVFIVPVDDNVKDVDLAVGKAAAMYLYNQIHEDCYINWGHGRTLNYTLGNLLQSCEHQLSIVSLTGGVDYYFPDLRSVNNSANMHVIPAPLIMSSREATQAILGERPVQDIFNMIWHSSMTVVGIGSMSTEATLIKRGIMTSNDFLLLGMQGAVGDILSQFINENGEKIHCSFEDRMIAISLEELKKLKNVVGVAGGTSKAAVIHAALQGGYLNKLVIDEETARLVLQMDEPQ